MERVVITGMGAITPVGQNVESFWTALKAGVCGIAPITAFDATEFKVKVAAEVLIRHGTWTSVRPNGWIVFVSSP